MWKRKLKDNWNLKYYGKFIAIVLLMSFWTTQVSGEPLTEPPESLSESGTNYYSDLEVELLIENLSAIAKEAIEQAGAEAARAAELAAIERQAELLREKAAAMREVEQWRTVAGAAKANGRKNTFIGIMAGLLGGLAIGITGTLLIGGR